MSIIIKTLPFVKTKSLYYFNENIAKMSVLIMQMNE